MRSPFAALETVYTECRCSPQDKIQQLRHYPVLIHSFVGSLQPTVQPSFQHDFCPGTARMRSMRWACTNPTYSWNNCSPPSHTLVVPTRVEAEQKQISPPKNFILVKTKNPTITKYRLNFSKTAHFSLPIILSLTDVFFHAKKNVYWWLFACCLQSSRFEAASVYLAKYRLFMS